MDNFNIYYITHKNVPAARYKGVGWVGGVQYLLHIPFLIVDFCPFSLNVDKGWKIFINFTVWIKIREFLYKN